MRKVIFAAALILPAFMPVLADDKADAAAQCVVISKAGIPIPAGTPQADVDHINTMIVSLCTCITDGMAGLGDDGAIALRVLAKTSPEQAIEGSKDPAKDKEITISIAKAEFDLSDADAEAWYARIDPQSKQLSKECAAKAQQ